MASTSVAGEGHTPALCHFVPVSDLVEERHDPVDCETSPGGHDVEGGNSHRNDTQFPTLASKPVAPAQLEEKPASKSPRPYINTYEYMVAGSRLERPARKRPGPYLNSYEYLAAASTLHPRVPVDVALLGAGEAVDEFPAAEHIEYAHQATSERTIETGSIVECRIDSSGEVAPHEAGPCGPAAGAAAAVPSHANAPGRNDSLSFHMPQYQQPRQGPGAGANDDDASPPPPHPIEAQTSNSTASVPSKRKTSRRFSAGVVHLGAEIKRRVSSWWSRQDSAIEIATAENGAKAGVAASKQLGKAATPPPVETHTSQGQSCATPAIGALEDAGHGIGLAEGGGQQQSPHILPGGLGCDAGPSRREGNNCDEENGRTPACLGTLGAPCNLPDDTITSIVPLRDSEPTQSAHSQNSPRLLEYDHEAYEMGLIARVRAAHRHGQFSQRRVSQRFQEATGSRVCIREQREAADLWRRNAAEEQRERNKTRVSLRRFSDMVRPGLSRMTSRDARRYEQLLSEPLDPEITLAPMATPLTPPRQALGTTTIRPRFRRRSSGSENFAAIAGIASPSLQRASMIL